MRNVFVGSIQWGTLFGLLTMAGAGIIEQDMAKIITAIMGLVGLFTTPPSPPKSLSGLWRGNK